MKRPAPKQDEKAAEAAFQVFVRENLRRNYAANYLHGMLGMTGFRLLSAPTFIPAYLFMLTGSSALVGLGQALQQVGQAALPLFGASAIEHRERVLPAANLIGWGMRIPIGLMALAAWFLEGPALVASLMLLLLMLGLFGGAQRVVFQLLMAKVIPVELRGRLQAMRNVTGGLIAAALSYFAGSWLIESEVLGNGYATTFLLVFILTSLGLTALSLLLREPTPPKVRPRTRLRERAKDIGPLIRGDRDYRNFLIAQSLAMGSRFAAPFYILHAGESVHLSGQQIGLFSLAYLGADTLSNLAWGYFGDRSGFRWSFIAAMAIGVASTVLMLTAKTAPMFLIAFIGLGACASGYLMSAVTMVLEFGAREDTALRLGISSTVEGVTAAAFPLAGGLLAAALGYAPVFWLAAGAQGAALLVLIFGVVEPRGRHVTADERPDDDPGG